MNTYTLYYEIGGHKMKSVVTAPDEGIAREMVRGKIKFLDPPKATPKASLEELLEKLYPGIDAKRKAAAEEIVVMIFGNKKS